MPIVIRPSRRAKPVIFFRGNLDEARRLPLKDITQAFAHTGVEMKPDDAAALAKIMLAHAEGIRQGENKLVVTGTPAGTLAFNITGFGNGRMLITQHPAIHGITNHGGGMPFESLKSILKTGFRGTLSPNAFVHPRNSAKNKFACGSHPSTKDGEMTRGDAYAIEMLSPIEGHDVLGTNLAFVSKASTGEISRIRIRLKFGLDAGEVSARKEFYCRELSQYGIPIKFVRHKL